MSNKILSREEVVLRRDQLKAEGKRVGFTSGVFDILHPGHVAYLEQARSLVDLLVVGVNSDQSVRSNKGDSRPINGERARCEVLAGLSSVDLLFVFSESNNNKNVELLKPDLYIKAGDYSAEKLSSKSIVESYGGRVELVPFREGLSTTGVIEKIRTAIVSKGGETIEYERRPAVFLDRDGTINEHIEYLSDPNGFKAVPGSFEAIKRLRDLGYRIVVVSNQPGIGLGYFTREDLYAVNREMMRQASRVGASFDKIYFCPHSKADGCECRKPGTYFVARAERELNVDIARSFVIGDMTSDIKFGKNAGCRSILVGSGRGGSDGMYQVTADHSAKDLADAAAWIAGLGEVKPLPAVTSDKSIVGGDDTLLKAAASLASGLERDYEAVFGSILGAAALIEQKTSGANRPSTVGEGLTLIRKSAQRGLAISKKLEALGSSSDAPKTRRSLQSCVKAVIELVSSAHGDECSFELLCPHDIEVDVADVAVVQMLLELCENALEAMQALPERFILFHVDKVALDARADNLELKPGVYARVSIIDHGDRLDAEQGQRFDKPVSSAQVKEFGRGLGLSMLMAKSVMRQHGGTVTVASRRQAGTNISLYFPLPN